VSFETTIHNIYAPQFSTPNTSSIYEESVIENYISMDFIIQDKPVEYYNPKDKSNSPEADMDELKKVIRMNSVKLEKPAFELMLKRDNSSQSSSYSKYLNKQKPEEDVASFNNDSNKYDSKSKEFMSNAIGNISKEFATPNDTNGQKEIAKVSFSKDLKHSYDFLNVGNQNHQISPDFQNLQDPGSRLMKKLNINQENDAFQNAKESYNIFRQKFNDYEIHKNSDFPVYDSHSKNGDNSPFSKSGQIGQETGKCWNNSGNTSNQAPMDGLSSYDQDTSKFTNRLQKMHSHNVTDNIDQRQELSNTDFVARIMTSLETLNNRIYDTSNISKFRDETVKSIDIGSSPDLGKTKDTSTFSGTKLINRMNGTKTAMSANNSEFILGNNTYASKLGNGNSLYFIL